MPNWIVWQHTSLVLPALLGGVPYRNLLSHRLLAPYDLHRRVELFQQRHGAPDTLRARHRRAPRCLDLQPVRGRNLSQREQDRL